jgi:hypothetical protein
MMTVEEKFKVVDQLTELADTASNAWASRLFMAAALWLRTEIIHTGGPNIQATAAIDQAIERVGKRERGERPVAFDSFIKGWLYPETHR